MAEEKIKFQTPEAYIAYFAADVQKILKTIRQTIQKAVPDAEEVISYNIPAFRYKGWVLYYSAYKNHFSLSCPPPFTVFDVFKKELSRYEVSKSAIRFPLDEPVPVKLITDIAKFRAKENQENELKKKKKG